MTSECKENRKFDLNDVPDKLPEEAWKILKKASDEKDIEEFRDVRAIPFPGLFRAVSDNLAGVEDVFQGSSNRIICRH
jgi:hypothetical protein